MHKSEMTNLKKYLLKCFISICRTIEIRNIFIPYRHRSDYIQKFQIFHMMITIWIRCHWKPMSLISKLWHARRMKKHLNGLFVTRDESHHLFQSWPFKCVIMFEKFNFYVQLNSTYLSAIKSWPLDTLSAQMGISFGTWMEAWARFDFK